MCQKQGINLRLNGKRQAVKWPKKTKKKINIQNGVTYIFQKIIMVVVDRGLEDVGGL